MVRLAFLGGAVGALVFGIYRTAGSLTSPLAVLLLVAAGLVVITLISLAVRLRDIIDDYGPWLLVQMVLWHHMGLPYHGDPVTNATWRYRGNRALTETGNARRCYYWPRKKLAGLRCTRTSIILSAAYGLVAYTVVTEWLLLAAAVAGTWWAGRRFWTWLDELAHHRDMTTPVHLATHHIAEVPLSYRPSGWIEISRDHTRAALRLPPDYNPEERKDKRLVEAVAAKVGIEDPLVKWRLVGAEPELVICESPHAPKDVTLADILPDICSAPWDRFIFGLGRPHAGRRTVVGASLSSDSPHIGLSMGSGAGKTALARLAIAQWAMKGGVVYILNPKRQGYQWAKGLKNVVVAETPAQIFYLLVWLGEQLDERNGIASEHADFDDRVPDGMLGAPVLVVVEELNLLTGRQVKWWKKNKEMAAAELGWDADSPLPKVSPALESLDDLAFAGRQSEMFCMFIGQRLSSKVISGDVLENVGVRILGRWSQRNWNMMAPEHPMQPVWSHRPGLVAVIASGKPHECQVAFATPADCRSMALMGEGRLPENVPADSIAPLPAFLAGQHWGTGTPKTQLGHSIGTASGLITLSRAVQLGYTAGKGLEAVRADRKRYRDRFPKPVERHNWTDYYSTEDVIAFYDGSVDRVSSDEVGSGV